MRLPRLILNPSLRPWIFLWQCERRENQRLRAELREWQNKVLLQAKISPLFQPPPKPIEQSDAPPIGPSAKKVYMAKNASPNTVPTAEEMLAQNGNQ